MIVVRGWATVTERGSFSVLAVRLKRLPYCWRCTDWVGDTDAAARFSESFDVLLVMNGRYVSYRNSPTSRDDPAT
jgi:hypothetical protein